MFKIYSSAKPNLKQKDKSKGIFLIQKYLQVCKY